MLRILWICLAVWLVRGDGRAPSFPSDFKVDVQVTTWNKTNTVRSFTVAYTAKGNGRGNALYVAETSDSEQYIKVFNFEKDAYFQANTLEESCKYADSIPELQKVGLFPVEFEKKDDRFGYLKPDTMFHFAGEKTFVSKSPAGVSLWTSSAAFEGGQCKVSFQWTTNGTTTPRCDRKGENFGACPPIPILCRLDCNVHTTTFTFTGYTEELDYEIFQEPLGYYCDGKEKIPSLPPLPDVFSLSAENVLPGSRDRVWYSHLWVDVENDAVVSRHRKENTDAVVISDYRAGVDYKIDFATGTCVPTETIGLQFNPESKTQLTFGERIYKDIQHSGNHRCRLSTCHVYATSEGEKVQNLYYAYANDLNVRAVPARIPAYMETREKGVIQMQRHIVAYDENVRYWNMFDLHRCFHQDDIRMLQVTVEGNTNFDKYIESMYDLREAYRKAVVSALGLTQKLRFTRFWMVPNQDKTGMEVTGFIYPASNRNGRRDVDTVTAFNQLKSAVDQGKFTFSVNGHLGAGILKYKGVDAYLGYRTSGGSSTQASKGYTSGNMAGLGFAMLFLGIAVTVAALYVVNRYYPKNQINKVLLTNEGS